MPFTIEESVLVATPVDTVWKLLENPWTWPQWWSACHDAQTLDRKPIRDGSELRLTLRPSWLTLTFRAKVQVAQPGRALIWSGTGSGVSGRHAFYLEARPNGTQVREREEFEGPLVGLWRLLGQARATRRMFQQNLKGLKRFAERGG